MRSRVPKAFFCNCKILSFQQNLGFEIILLSTILFVFRSTIKTVFRGPWQLCLFLRLHTQMFDMDLLQMINIELSNIVDSPAISSKTDLWKWTKSYKNVFCCQFWFNWTKLLAFLYLNFVDYNICMVHSHWYRIWRFHYFKVHYSVVWSINYYVFRKK